MTTLPDRLQDRLYLLDPRALAFEAEVVAHAEHAGQPSLLLDRSAFYPESGGQLGDRGSLGALAIVDVQLDEQGRVHHLLEAGAALPEVGARLEGAVAGARRRSHMALHTGQHLLSRALIEVAAAETLSARLGERTCTIDLDKKLSDAQAASAAALVNEIIDDDREIRSFFPTPAELAALPLRRTPKVTEDIRVVEVEGFDFTPCGGTHCARTSQVGLMQLTQLEGYKGKTRVHFAAGPRARDGLLQTAARLTRLAASFTCGEAEVEQNVDKLRADLKATRQSLGHAQTRLLEQLLREVETDLADDADLVLKIEADKKAAQKVAARLAIAKRRVVLYLESDDGLHVTIARGPEATLDAGAALKRLAAAHGGRGGGKPERAEGRFPRFDIDRAASQMLKDASDI